MKITELDDFEKLITKEYLDARLNQLKAEVNQSKAEIVAEMNHLHAELFKWCMGLFAGLYAGIIISFFVK